jgi:multiple sugar transport system ATP-binding protein
VQLAGTEHELVTAAPGSAEFEPGTAVQLELLRPLWFDAAGQRIAA